MKRSLNLRLVKIVWPLLLLVAAMTISTRISQSCPG